MTDLREVTTLDQDYERDELHRAIREVVATVAGKRVLFWMLEQCAIYRDPFTGQNAPTNYTIGKQAAGRVLISKLDEIDPRLYPSLLLDIADIRDVDRSAMKSLQQRKKENDDDLEG